MLGIDADDKDRDFVEIKRRCLDVLFMLREGILYTRLMERNIGSVMIP